MSGKETYIRFCKDALYSRNAQYIGDRNKHNPAAISFIRAIRELIDFLRKDSTSDPENIIEELAEVSELLSEAERTLL